MANRVWFPFETLGSFLTYALSFPSFYILNTLPSKPQSWPGIYIRIGIFRLWYLSVVCLLIKVWGYYPRASPSDEEWAVSWMQPEFLPCADVSLVINIGHGYWLDDEGSPSEYHLLYDKGASLECHRLEDKGLTPASHCYVRVVAR